MPKRSFEESRPEAPADDAALLREALKGVAALPDSGRASLRKKPPSPLPIQTLRDEAAVLAESLSDDIPLEIGLETGEELVFLRPGLSAQVLRRLRSGHWSVQDHLDLHGLRTDGARALLVEFLNHARHSGFRCLRIVHGKGLRSENREPVLKRKIGNWLAQRDEVLAFVQARPQDGGGGAVIVLLRAKGRKAPADQG
ncbi:MAG: Smr/MutS family protein [Burkholderiales bacterium]